MMVGRGKKAKPAGKRYESTEDNIGSVNISFFGMFPAEYFQGGELRLYRKEGLYFKEIHKTKVKKFELDPAGKMSGGDTNRLYDGKIWFSEKGPVAQEGGQNHKNGEGRLHARISIHAPAALGAGDPKPRKVADPLVAGRA